GGDGRAPHIGVAPMPDTYRGAFRDPHDAGRQYAAGVADAAARLAADGLDAGVFYCESMLGCGGQIVLPDGYLHDAYAAVRAAGGLCLADEVQVGFGRDGEYFWAFEHQGEVPD